MASAISSTSFAIGSAIAARGAPAAPSSRSRTRRSRSKASSCGSHHQLVEAPYLDPDGTRVYNTEIGDAYLDLEASRFAGAKCAGSSHVGGAADTSSRPADASADRAVVHEHVLVQSVGCARDGSQEDAIITQGRAPRARREADRLRRLGHAGVVSVRTNKEHRAGSEAVGLFDVSHMGARHTCAVRRTRVADRIATNAVASAPSARRSTRCCVIRAGGVVDDCIFYKRSDNEFFVIVNASNTAKDPSGSAITRRPSATSRTSPIGPASSRCKVLLVVMVDQLAGRQPRAATGASRSPMRSPCALHGRAHRLHRRRRLRARVPGRRSREAVGGAVRGREAARWPADRLGRRDTLRLESKLLLYATTSTTITRRSKRASAGRSSSTAATSSARSRCARRRRAARRASSSGFYDRRGFRRAIAALRYRRSSTAA